MKSMLRMLTPLALCAASMVACRSFDTSQTAEQTRFVRQYAASEVRALRIASSSGDVTIRGGDNEQAQVIAVTTGDCKVDANLRHNEIEVVLRGTQFWSQCRGTLSVEVPRKLAVDVASGSGDLRINDVAGTLSLRTGSGNVRASGAIAQLVAKTGSGNMRIDGLAGPAVVTAGSGDISLAYETLPEGTLQLEQGSGNTRLTLPHGPILTKVQTGSGKVDNQVDTAPDARFTVRGSLGSGDLRILRRS